MRRVARHLGAQLLGDHDFASLAIFAALPERDRQLLDTDGSAIRQDRLDDDILTAVT